MKRILLSIVTIVSMAVLHAQVPAFPDAQGGGAISKGGRGGKIIEVTNLNDAGTGSFRAACNASGPRIVVFRVSGIIDLKDLIYISQPYLTIAGQTAPGDGITIRGLLLPSNRSSLLYIATHDVTIQYLKLRLGYNSSFVNLNGKNIVLDDGAEKVIVDHCSLSWAQDKNFSAWGHDTANPIRNVTLQYSIISEPILDSYGNATGMIMGGGGDAIARVQTNLDVHHNYFASNRHRTPLFKGASGSIINNITYNYNNYALGWEGGATLDIIGNIYKNGPTPSANKEIAYRDDNDENVVGPPSIYIEGNKGPNNTNPANDNWKMIAQRTVWVSPGIAMSTSYKRNQRQPNVAYPITVSAVSDLETALFSTVGAYRGMNELGEWTLNRDAVDKRVIADYTNGTGVFLTSGAGGEKQVGGYPTYSSGTPYLDTDKDGMANAWEIKYAFNPSSAADGNEDADKDGYTNVEEFLNGTDPKQNVINVATIEQTNQLEIYPNPAKTELFISGNLSGNTTYEITTIEGKALQTGVVSGGNINIENLRTGIYIIKIKTEVGEKVQRFVKE